MKMHLQKKTLLLIHLSKEVLVISRSTKLFRDPQVLKLWFKLQMLRSRTTAVTVQHVKLLKKKIRASVQLGVRLRLQRAAVHKSPVGKLS